MFRKLVSLDEANRIFEDNFSPKPVGVEKVSISQAYNRVLAEDVVASIDVPPFDRATVDGYAVRASDTFGAEEDKPITLRFCGSIPVGSPPRVVVKNGTAAEIVTGAPVPQDADAAVMIEYTSRKGDTVFVRHPVSKGENVMRAGSDIKKGETVLGKGEVLSPHKIGVLAALGFTEVAAYKRPKVAILSTGPEIVEPGKPLPPGKIYDINTHAIGAAALECGGEPISLGIIPDETEQLEAALDNALNLADLVVTSGGVSVGPKDIIPQVANALGKPGVLVSGIAIKPGKPTTIALVKEKPVFCLPGHPTSSLLVYHMIVGPTIRRMAGRASDPFETLKAFTTMKLFPARGRRTYVMVKLSRDKSGRVLASPVPLGLSGAITTLAKAEGFVEIRENQQFINAGDEVTVYLFKPRIGDMPS